MVSEDTWCIDPNYC